MLFGRLMIVCVQRLVLLGFCPFINISQVLHVCCNLFLLLHKVNGPLLLKMEV